jgi:enoyl-CoA hydratase/carnithine racemase
MAQELAAKPRLAIRAAKEALNLERHGDPEAGLAYERRAWSGLFGTPDQREGMAAFLKDREPDFE